jgi:glycosyltransferase involved in cell wall biosynthesis
MVTEAIGKPEEGRQGISCFIVCQNEEAQIRDCLKSVRWCDELVVVDGGSTDRTPEICKAYADRFIVNPWPGYVEQKAFGLAQTTQPWVLNVDADEVVSPELRDEIQALLRRPPPNINGYYVPRLVYYLGRWWYRGIWYPGYRLRLLRRSHTTWGGTNPHDLAMVRGRTRRLKNPLLHLTYRSISDHLASVNHLTDISAVTTRRVATRVGLICRPAWRFAWTYSFAGGFREGVAGLFVCMTAAFYVFLRLAKRMERDRLSAAGNLEERSAARPLPVPARAVVDGGATTRREPS